MALQALSGLAIKAQAFPLPDPIPLPAPVWLFKALHQVTLSLHFVAVGLLLGGLALTFLWRFTGRRRGRLDMVQGAGELGQRLPTVMAYVVNLGVPPLLFTQVLYGRALYTSSVLIGAYWIAVIGLIIASYYGLYLAAGRSAQGRPWSALPLASLLLALAVGFIYSNNMTLMLRPAVWAEMYAADPGGLHLNAGDPTVWPRFLFMVVGSLPLVGLSLVLKSHARQLSGELGGEVRQLFRSWGGALAAVGIVAQAAMGFWVFRAQPEGVAEKVMSNGFYGPAAWAWLATAALVALVGWRVRERVGKGWAFAGAALVFLNVVATVLVRDGIRDMSLLRLGFDVWDRQVVTNWSVVGLFLLLFVAGVATVLWLIKVAASAKSVEESYV